MTAMSRSAVLLCLLVAAAVGSAAHFDGAAAATDNGKKVSQGQGGLHHYFYLDSCAQLETIVRSTVESALQQDVRLTAGLLRIFFHDCFPQGCDASVLLDNGERQFAPNLGLQQAALQLIETIRSKVHAACGPTVSCADITVLATRDAVNLAGGPTFTVNLGRKDSLAPASQNDVFSLPPPSFTADQLLKSFSDKGLDNFDLVALSGAHTVGRARCSAFGNPSTPPKDDLGQCLAGICTGGGGDPNRLRDLDFLTPELFDNMYFTALTLNKGIMLNSDQVLATHPSTNWLVKGFADNHWWFFQQFATSMVKMSEMKGPQGNVGEIRRNCFKPNSALNISADHGLLAASA
ncbi:hypothetical protein PR202_ga18491 [Eleusine coracana subsp. coracana]|uniref:Peroxidase n=1 Tax=Eleusine coracana subsp. coracana TaxID=191504 RepID=A0AAV5CTX4_ELECO|nr:hypothetical protein QOZ80_4AG0298470 [Eleusine coracana subsp. coracana]GJN01240.1 hypothetical protein PR202_ga18491 [Eleusine coracana subsp. coracana]